MKATLTSKSQITIPTAIRRRLGLQAGQVLEFDEVRPPWPPRSSPGGLPLVRLGSLRTTSGERPMTDRLHPQSEAEIRRSFAMETRFLPCLSTWTIF
ncbi:MAG TPA: AbrB/MazE/SpoVT family DNA-binding domain-containing protein [Thermoanaerobaculia bacterium]|nr:AbrB/MazE/SpoVT family DNA-binding domain-containing protein [Thermoanaerobaculia bacterium]